MFKTLLKIAALVMALAYFVFAMVKIDEPEEDVICQGVDIHVNDLHHTHFFTASDVRELLVSKDMFVDGAVFDAINVDYLEHLLLKSPYIDEAHCYKTINHRIVVDVVPREPILHVLNDAGQDFYIDNKGELIPRGHHAIDLVVLTGAVEAATAGRTYRNMGLYLIENEFWNRQVQEIHVGEDGRLEMTPLVGEHTILLGDTAHFADKMRRLRIFYQKGLSKAGWNKYKTISVEFDNQIVCVRAKE